MILLWTVIEMLKLCVGIVAFAAICVVASNAALSDEVKQFKFTKAQDGSDEFNFEWVKHVYYIFSDQFL